MFRSALICGFLGLSAAAHAQSYPSPTFNTVKVLNGADLRPTVNALLYGADPTGVNDSTAAINNAIQASQYYGYVTSANPYRPGSCVYLPAGNYKIHDSINLDKWSGCLYGDGRVQTWLMVDSSTFNLSANGVLNLQNSSGGTGPEIHDLNIMLNQPDTSVRASLPPVPPAIYSQNVARQKIHDIQIGGGFGTCIDGRGQSGGSFFENIECGSLSFGLRLDGASDSTHITNWHHWNFGYIGKSGLSSIYVDGTNVGLELGRIDSLTAVGIMCETANIVFTTNAANSTDSMLFSNVILDASMLIHNAGPPTGTFITNFQTTGGPTTPSTVLPIWMKGGALRITNYRVGANPGGHAVQVDAGSLNLINGLISANGTVNQAVVVNAGLLTIANSQLGSSAGATAPVVEQVGGSLQFIDNKMVGAPSGGTPIAVKFDVDSAWNLFSGGAQALIGWAVQTPATITAGNYGSYSPALNVIPQSGPASVNVTAPTGLAAVNIKASDGASPADIGFTAGGEAWVTGVNGSATFVVGEPGKTDLAIQPGGLFSFGQGTGSHHSFAGRVAYTAPARPVVVCGTSPTIDSQSTFMSGRVVCGTGTVTSGTITFDASDKPTTYLHCNVSPETTLASFAYSSTITAITFSATSLTGAALNYRCDGL